MTRPNIVLVCLDTVRKDAFDEHMPRLQSLSDASYDEMRAASAWSVPSHASMMTGHLPHEHGLHAKNRDFGDLDADETLPGRLEGYTTWSVSANVYASSAFGWDGLFDHERGISPSAYFGKGLDIDEHIRNRDDGDGIAEFVKAAAAHDYPVRSFLNGALLKLHDAFEQSNWTKPFDYGGERVARQAWRAASDTEPSFVFVNFMDAHGPQSPHRGLADHGVSPSFDSKDFDDWDVNVADHLGEYGEQVEQVRDLYAAEVDYLDRVVSKMVKRIRQSTSRPTVFIITADHGENLGFQSDRWLMNHTSSLTEGLLHVPFEVIGANVESVGWYTSHLDLADAIVALSRREPMASEFTTEPLAEIAGSGTGTPDENPEYWDRAIRAVYDAEAEEKLVYDSLGEVHRWDVSAPPSHQELLTRDIGDLAEYEARFSQPLSEFVAGLTDDSSSAEVDSGVEARLEELGYM